MTDQRLAPFERLGVDVSNLGTTQDILAIAGANFTAIPITPTYLDNQNQVRNSKQKIVVRDDNYVELGSHKPGYNIIQYSTIVDIALETVGLRPSDNALTHAGILGEGEVFFANIDLGSLHIDPNGIDDEISRVLTIIGSHNGKTPVLLAPEFIRLVCTNQLPPASTRDFKGWFAAKHTKNALDKLKLAREALGIADAAQKLFVEQAEALLAIPANKDTVVRVAKDIWGEPKDGASERAKTLHSTRLNRLVESFEGNNNSGNYGNNRWSVYNAFTEYCDHLRGGNADKRAEATMKHRGPVAKYKTQALDLLLA